MWPEELRVFSRKERWSLSPWSGVQCETPGMPAITGWADKEGLLSGVQEVLKGTGGELGE